MAARSIWRCSAQLNSASLGDPQTVDCSPRAVSGVKLRPHHTALPARSRDPRPSPATLRRAIIRLHSETSRRVRRRRMATLRRWIAEGVAGLDDTSRARPAGVARHNARLRKPGTGTDHAKERPDDRGSATAARYQLLHGVGSPVMLGRFGEPCDAEHHLKRGTDERSPRDSRMWRDDDPSR